MLYEQNPLSSTSSSSLSGSSVNSTKPMESGVHQILPFKLSENNDSVGNTSSLKKSSSPKMGYQKLTPTMSSSYAEQQLQKVSRPNLEQHLEASHQRTGSSPALIPPSGSVNLVPTTTTTSTTNLPKSSSMTSRDVPRVDYSNNNQEDKVIYF